MSEAVIVWRRLEAVRRFQIPGKELYLHIDYVGIITQYFQNVPSCPLGQNS
jgi:hypothetical protein